MMKLFLGIILFYILGVAALYVMQRSLIFFPDKAKPVAPQGVEIAAISDDVSGWFIPARGSDKPVILYFHGNAGHHGHRIYKAQHYIQAGYGVLLVGYPGYGGNAGIPSEQSFYEAGRKYMLWLQEYAPQNAVIIYGESIGSGTAVQMAIEHDVAALVLETPFSSLVETAAGHYPFVPVRYLLQDRFMNVEKIEKIKAPLLILHGHQDRTIPFSSAQKLFDAALEPKTFTSFPQGNHNDLYDFGAYTHVLDFLSGIASAN